MAEMYRKDKALLRVGLKPTDDIDLKSKTGKIKTTLLANQCLYVKYIVGYKQITLILEPEFENALRSKNCTQALAMLGITIVEPPGQKAKRSIFVKGVEPDMVNSKSVHQLRDEIQEKNKVIVEEVSVLGKYKTVLKIVLEKKEDALHLLNNGVKLGYQRLIEINPDNFVEMNFCTRCYSWDHLGNKCDRVIKPICSECGSADHRFIDCNAKEKCCYNCEDLHYEDKKHSALSSICPVKKEKLEKLKKEKQEREEKEKETLIEIQNAPPPASVWGQPVWKKEVTTPKVEPNSQLVKDQINRIEKIAINYAAAMARGGEGRFRDSYESFMKLNEVIPLKMPEISSKVGFIMAKLLNGDNSKDNEEKETEPPVKVILSENKEKEKDDSESEICEPHRETDEQEEMDDPLFFTLAEGRSEQETPKGKGRKETKGRKKTPPKQKSSAVTWGTPDFQEVSARGAWQESPKETQRTTSSINCWATVKVPKEIDIGSIKNWKMSKLVEMLRTEKLRMKPQKESREYIIQALEKGDLRHKNLKYHY